MNTLNRSMYVFFLLILIGIMQMSMHYCSAKFKTTQFSVSCMCICTIVNVWQVLRFRIVQIKIVNRNYVLYRLAKSGNNRVSVYSWKMKRIVSYMVKL